MPQNKICSEFANLHIFTHERAEKYAIKIHAARRGEGRYITIERGDGGRQAGTYQYKRSQIKWVGKRQHRMPLHEGQRKRDSKKQAARAGARQGCSGQSVANFYWRDRSWVIELINRHNSYGWKRRNCRAQHLSTLRLPLLPLLLSSGAYFRAHKQKRLVNRSRSVDALWKGSRLLSLRKKLSFRIEKMYVHSNVARFD